MEQNDDFELFLNHMGAWESINSPASYDEYVHLVILFMQHKGKYLFQGELVERYGLENPKDLSMYGNYKEWGQQMRNDKWEPIYYCILADYYVQPDDEFYDLFFAYRLRQIDLIHMDRFLTYQLEKYYGNNVKAFCRFLALVMRKHQNQLLNSDICLTVEEWMQEAKSIETLSIPALKGPPTVTEDNTEPMSIDEAAKFLKLKKSTLYEKTSEQSIPHHKKGNKLYFYKEELESWIKQGKVKTAHEIEREAHTYSIKKNKGR